MLLACTTTNEKRKNNMPKTYVKTSEAVAASHPDKVADQIGDAIFDYLRTFKDNPQSAVEIACAADRVLVFGEIDKDIVKPQPGVTNVKEANPDLVRKIKEITISKIREIGYTKFAYNPEVKVALVTQSAEINNAVEENDDHEAAAGDQGIVTGFATSETKQYHALHFILAHHIMKELEDDRKNKRISWLNPDAKSQVTVKYEYSEKGLDKPLSIENILVSQCHSEIVGLDEVRETLTQRVKDITVEFLKDHNKFDYSDTLLNSLDKTEFLINPAGEWNIGGPKSDSGLCLADGTLVYSTNRGICKIEDLHIGDNVITESGTADIIDHFSNGEKSTFVITDSNGVSIESTGNHPFRVLDNNENIVWKKAEDLTEGDYLIKKSTEFLHRTSKKLNKIKFKNKNLNIGKDFCYVMGWLLGDGNTTATKEDRLTFYYNYNDPFEKVHLFNKLISVFGEENIKYYDYQDDRFQIFSKDFYRELLNQKLITQSIAKNDSIPDKILTYNDALKGAFLQGLFDADGHVSVGGRNDTSYNIRLTTASAVLAQQVSNVLFSMGIVSKVYEAEARPGGLKNGRIIQSGKRYDVLIQGAKSKQKFFTKIGFGLEAKKSIYENDKTLKQEIIDDWKRYPLFETVRELLKTNPKKSSRWISGSGRPNRKYLYTHEKIVFILDLFEDKKNHPAYKKLQYIIDNDLQIVKIKKIKKSVANTWDITLNDQTHAFVANGFIVHNTGRKLVVDNYGSAAPIGGGSSSGKSFTKVDRSGAYYARHIAKSIVASGMADKCLVELGFAIGVPKAVSVNIETFGTETTSLRIINDLVSRRFDFKVQSMIDLSNSIDKVVKTSEHGNYTDESFPWEQTAEL